MPIRQVLIFVALLTCIPLTFTGSRAVVAAEPAVQVIYAIPTDRQGDLRFEIAISTAIRHVRDWYASQLDGRTFTIEEPALLICHVGNPADYYEGENGRDRVMVAVQHCAKIRWWSELYVWAIYIDADFDWQGGGELGRGGGGIVIIHGGDLEGLVKADGTFRLCPDFPPREPHGWIGGLAHELAHAFGTDHPPRCDEGYPDAAYHYVVPGSDPPVYKLAYEGDDCDINALMWLGFYWGYPETTSFTDQDKAILRSSPFIRTPPPPFSPDTFFVGRYKESYLPGGGY